MQKHYLKKTLKLDYLILLREPLTMAPRTSGSSKIVVTEPLLHWIRLGNLPHFEVQLKILVEKI